MFFSRKNRLDTKASPDSLRPMLHVAACLKGYLKQLAQREVESLEELRMVRGAFAAFLPWLAIFLIGMGIVIALAYLWLG